MKTNIVCVTTGNTYFAVGLWVRWSSERSHYKSTPERITLPILVPGGNIVEGIHRGVFGLCARTFIHEIMKTPGRINELMVGALIKCKVCKYVVGWYVVMDMSGWPKYYWELPRTMVAASQWQTASPFKSGTNFVVRCWCLLCVKLKIKM